VAGGIPGRKGRCKSRIGWSEVQALTMSLSVIDWEVLVRLAESSGRCASLRSHGLRASLVARDSGDEQLCEAAHRLARGVVDAELGGGVFKLRIGRRNEGRSRGYRALMFYRPGSLAVFAYAFAKNDRANIGPQELTAFRRLAAEVLGFDDRAIETAVNSGAWREVDCNGEAIPKRGNEIHPPNGSRSSSRRPTSATHDARVR